MHVSTKPLALLAAMLLSACSASINEAQLLKPVAGGSITQAQVAAAAPAYTLTPQTIVAADGVKLHAVLLRQPGATATVLYFGGNGYTIGAFGVQTAQAFAPFGVDLMIVDHRGFGQSEGKPTFDALERDGLAAFDHLGMQVDPRAIVVHGLSMGSFMAGHVAANRAAAGAVLEGSVTTTEAWIAARTPALAKPFVTVKLPDALKGRGNTDNVKRIEEPLMLLVGARDDVTPPALSRALYEASPLPANRKTLTIVPDAGHGNALMRPDAAKAYRAFLASLRP